MNETMAKANPGAGASQIIHSDGGAGGKLDVQASSPHVRPRRDSSVNSGPRSKRLEVYDPVVAGK